MTHPIKVMIVNDSPYMRQYLEDLVSSPKTKVVSQARDGLDALSKLEKERPDVILLDLVMPKIDGITFLEQVMRKDPIPIIVISSYTNSEEDIIFNALDYGAVDFFPITTENRSDLDKLKEGLISKIEEAAVSHPQLLVDGNIKSRKKRPLSGREATKVVVIGSSTGGPSVLNHVMSEIPADLHASFLLVQHMPKYFTPIFAKRLGSFSQLEVREAKNSDKIVDGQALLAPGDYHMIVNEYHRIKLDQSPKRLGLRPSVNLTMISASEVYGSDTIGVLLSGMGEDGAFGMQVIKKKGGATVAQDKASSVIFGMANAAQVLGAVDKLVPIETIAMEIIRAVERNV